MLKDNMDPAAQTSFLCSSPEEKDKWLGTLKKLVKEFQLREMAEKAKNPALDLMKQNSTLRLGSGGARKH